MPLVNTVRINGPALRDLRTQRGLSVQQLAKKIGRHRQSVTRLERKEQIASRVFAYQLANALGVDLADFTIGDDASETDEVAA